MLFLGIAIGIIIGQPPILTPILFCVAFPFLWLAQRFRKAA